MHTRTEARKGLSLMELLAALTIIGVLAAIVLPRFGDSGKKAKIQACAVHKMNIEVQAQLWYRTKSAWPNSNLSDIGANTTFFPEGVPVCPVDGTSYTIDNSTHRVIGHTH